MFVHNFLACGGLALSTSNLRVNAAHLCDRFSDVAQNDSLSVREAVCDCCVAACIPPTLLSLQEQLKYLAFHALN